MSNGTCFYVLTLIATPLRTLDLLAQSPQVEYEAYTQFVEQWRSDVEFASTFKYSEGRSVSFDEGLAERFVSGEPIRTAKGVLYKKGLTVRFSLRPDSGNWGDPFDEMSDQQVQIRHMIQQDNVGHSIYFTAREQRLQGTAAAGPLSQGYISPLAPFGDYRHSLTDLYTGSVTATKQVGLVRHDDKLVEISVSVDIGKERWQKRVSLQTDMSPPAIREMELLIESGADEPEKWNVRRVVRLSDFRTCAGGPVAAKVVRVIETRAGEIRTTIWNSADLGRQMVSPQDFTMDVPAGVNLAGLKREIDLGRPRQIELRKISPDILGELVFAVPDDRPIEGSPWSLFYAAIGLVMLLVVFFLGWRFLRPTRTKSIR